ncbi:hypothetical protein TWF506_009392 [Arthrobotrys conoides]|uniref:Uncharacterized protein n=1 Tax=Arthrobotrys conoides TaxID=74498 RepID=A0AAN8N8K6_9PEZI
MAIRHPRTSRSYRSNSYAAEIECFHFVFLCLGLWPNEVYAALWIEDIQQGHLLLTASDVLTSKIQWAVITIYKAVKYLVLKIWLHVLVSVLVNILFFGPSTPNAPPNSNATRGPEVVSRWGSGPHADPDAGIRPPTISIPGTNIPGGNIPNNNPPKMPEIKIPEVKIPNFDYSEILAKCRWVDKKEGSESGRDSSEIFSISLM